MQLDYKTTEQCETGSHEFDVQRGLKKGLSQPESIVSQYTVLMLLDVVFFVQAHPEDGVSYASISYTKKTSKAWVSCLTGCSGGVVA